MDHISNKIGNLYTIAPKVWGALIIGWLWLFLCFVLGWKVDSAGGILVGACIVAELFYLTCPLETTIENIREHDEYIVMRAEGERKYLLRYDDTFRSVLVREPDGKERRMEIKKATGFEKFTQDCRDQLYELSSGQERKTYMPKNEALSNKTGVFIWKHQYTTTRIKEFVLTTIVVSAVFGTVIWAYF